MPRQHDFINGDYGCMICRHCGQDAYHVTMEEGTPYEEPCVLWSDIPKVKRTPPRRTLWQELKGLFL